MFNIFDGLTKKDYHFVVKEFNLIEVIKMMHTAISNQNYIFGLGSSPMTILNNGIEVVENQECYIERLNVNLTTKGWNTLIDLCRKQNYKLVVKNEPNVMYFTKTEES